MIHSTKTTTLMRMMTPPIAKIARNTMILTQWQMHSLIFYKKMQAENCLGKLEEAVVFNFS